MDRIKFVKDYYGVLLAVVIVIIIITGTIKDYKKQKEVFEYGKKTIGRVVDFSYKSKGFCSIEYIYEVKNVKYKGSVGVENFNCADGTKGCVGKKFYVYYSSKTPEYSRIYLGKYEKYKTSVEFFK